MRYVRAQDVFPAEILKMIQIYVDGEYVYIPRKEEHKKAWGEVTQSRTELSARNAAIFGEYQMGVRVGDLAKTYFLSEKSILRIIRQQKQLQDTAG